MDTYARNAELLRYFEEVVLPFTGSDCLLWPYGRNNCGYGRISIGGKRLVVSREACRRTHGEPSHPKMDAAHECGNGKMGCVNPRHLSWKTRSENASDTVKHGRSPRGERCAQSKLTREQVAEIIHLKGVVSQVSLARLCGVNPVTIGKIQRGQLWGWMNEAS